MERVLAQGSWWQAKSFERAVVTEGDWHMARKAIRISGAGLLGEDKISSRRSLSSGESATDSQISGSKLGNLRLSDTSGAAQCACAGGDNDSEHSRPLDAAGAVL